MCGNQNQLDLDKTINKLISLDGFDKDVYREHMKDHGCLDKAVILEKDWDFYQQYEGGMQPVRDYITFSQSAQVIAHEELFESGRIMELLALPHFLMHENVSKKRG